MQPTWFQLSGFGDEISPELHEQLDLLLANGIRHLELRGIWNKNVLDLTDEEASRAKSLLDDRGVAVSCIASPIGKVPIDTDFDSYMPRFDKALEVAKHFQAPYVRIFSFYVQRGREDDYRDEIVRRLAVFSKRAEEERVVLLHENDQELFGERAERALDIVRTIDSPALRIAFDPGNYVLTGVRPFEEAFPLLADHISYIHIKDVRSADGHACLAGQGDGQIARLLQALEARGYRGFLSLEPHLTLAGRSSGFSGPSLFAEAIRSLKNLLKAP